MKKYLFIFVIINLGILGFYFPTLSFSDNKDLTPEAYDWLKTKVVKIDTGVNYRYFRNERKFTWSYTEKKGLKTFNLIDGGLATEVLSPNNKKYLKYKNESLFIDSLDLVIEEFSIFGGTE